MVITVSPLPWVGFPGEGEIETSFISEEARASSGIEMDSLPLGANTRHKASATPRGRQEE